MYMFKIVMTNITTWLTHRVIEFNIFSPSLLSSSMSRSLAHIKAIFIAAASLTADLINKFDWSCSFSCKLSPSSSPPPSVV